MLGAVETGQIDGILVYHPDRLHRRAAELERFVDFVEKYGVEIQTVSQGAVDLTTSSGRMVARMLGAASQHEVDRARERMIRAKKQMVETGKYRGGPRPYGFEGNGIVVRDDEAAVIRYATTAVIADRTLAAIARDLNSKGKRTSSGKEWTYSRLKEVLVRPRNAGLSARGTPQRRATRDSGRREFEVLGRAVWPAIVEESDWRTAVSKLTDPSRLRQNGNDARWLGSGLYKCGKCGSSMRTAPYGDSSKPKQERKHLYRCTSAAHLTISTDKTDEFVRAVVVELLDDSDIAARMEPGNQGLARYRKRREALRIDTRRHFDDYKAGYLSGPEYNEVKRDVESEMAQVDAQISRALSSSTTSAVLAAQNPAAAFLAAPIDTQKAIVRVLMTIEIKPVSKRGARWSSERVACMPIIPVGESQ
ncbi:recombinase family protein [Nesterenkonia lutea]